MINLSQWKVWLVRLGVVAGDVMALGNFASWPTDVRTAIVAASGVIIAVEHAVGLNTTTTTTTAPPDPSATPGA